jgi:hypothetical protein
MVILCEIFSHYLKTKTNKSKHTQWHFPTASEAVDPLKAKQRLQTNMKRRQPDEPSSSSSSAAARQPPQKKQAYEATSKLGNIISTEHMKKSLSSSAAASASASSSARKSSNHNSVSEGKTSVAIIVPYRDIHPKQNRAKHLKQFVPFMLQFLSKQLSKQTIIDYHIYIIEQSNDARKFNRGKLLNIGFDVARKNRARRKSKTDPDSDDNKMFDHDVFIFHDVDLLPTNEELLGPYYTQFPKVPIHIARVWDRYSNNPKYFGGIVSFSSSDMKRINGYPNTFWGWGGEDDEMQNRCEKLNLKWKSPVLTGSAAARGNGTPIITDLEEMNITQKLSFLRSNRKWKCNVKWEALDEHEKTWRSNGLADLDYKILAMTDLDTENMRKANSNASNGNVRVGRSRATKVTVDVKLNGNHWSNDKCNIDEM